MGYSAWMEGARSRLLACPVAMLKVNSAVLLLAAVMSSRGDLGERSSSACGARAAVSTGTLGCR